MRDAISIPGAQNVLEVLDDRFGQTATLTLALGASACVAIPVPITEWQRCIPAPTLADIILDRLVHNAHRIELKGESQTEYGEHLRYNLDRTAFSSSNVQHAPDYEMVMQGETPAHCCGANGTGHRCFDRRRFSFCEFTLRL